MEYRSILVHLDAGKTVPQRLEVAIALAQAHDAHLTCLYAVDATPIPAAAVEAGQVLIEAHARMLADMRRSARAAYDDLARRSGYAKLEWRQSEAGALQAVSLHARYADLVVIGQKNEQWPSGVGREFQEKIPLAAGRPVLVVPYAYERRPIAERVLVAWNAGREAARAVSDAMPLLKRAKQVVVAAFDPQSAGGAHGEQPGADIALYLARHGVKVEAGARPGGEVDVGNLLLSLAFDARADLIVMGAWGHSRLHELVLGGVTRTLLQSMTVPVLLSH